ncbi:MAG: hypothetical protein QOJ99_2957 [Bryobacterales bacterium]|jgi:hypothetical protein|nr:hypothetical protein [Bryobacterales bacterium]
MGVDAFLYIFGEVRVRQWRVSQTRFKCLGNCDCLVDRTAGTLGRSYYSHRPMVLFNYNLSAFPHTFE